MRAAIPERPSEITADWLGEALARTGILNGQAVASLSQTVLGEGAGFLGDILRLEITYDGVPDRRLPATLVAKLPKLANREMGELLGAYERENMFYMTIARDLPLATPRMYYGDFDRDKTSERQEQILRGADRLPLWMTGATTGLARWIVRRKARRYILLLEDIVADPGDQVAGVTPERARAVLANVARAHAAWWGRPMQEHFWLLPLDVDVRMRHGLFRRSQAAFEAQYGDVLGAGLAAFVAEIGRAGATTMQRLCEAPATLLHCDLRLDNVFFRGEDVVLFDWQLVRRGPAAYDVAYFLSGALCEDTAPAVIDELLAGYHAALVAGGVTGYGIDGLRRDYALALRTVLMALATIDTMDMGGGRGDALIAGWLRRLQARLEHSAAL